MNLIRNLLLILILLILVGLVFSVASVYGGEESNVFGGISNPFKKMTEKVRKARDERKKKKEIKESPEEVRKGFNLFHKIANKYADVITKFATSKYCGKHKSGEWGTCDLDAMWKDKCSKNSKDPEWENSLFCALGSGNELASLIFRLRFFVPETKESHVLHPFINNLPDELTGNEFADTQLKDFIKTIFNKINKNHLLKWSDLPGYAIIAAKFPIIKNKYIEPQMNEFGLSLKKYPGARHGTTSAVNLNKLRDEKCGKDGKGPWQNTLFCALASNDREHYVAQMLGRLKFMVPSEPNKHLLSRISEIINTGLSTPPEGATKQSWTNWGIQKAFNYQLSAIMNKINTNQLLTWDDLNDLFVVGSVAGVGGFNMRWFAEPYMIGPANKVGLDIAPEDIN